MAVVYFTSPIAKGAWSRQILTRLSAQSWAAAFAALAVSTVLAAVLLLPLAREELARLRAPVRGKPAALQSEEVGQKTEGDEHEDPE